MIGSSEWVLAADGALINLAHVVRLYEHDELKFGDEHEEAGVYVLTILGERIRLKVERQADLKIVDAHGRRRIGERR